MYECDDVKEWKRNNLYHGIIYLFAVDLIVKRPIANRDGVGGGGEVAGGRRTRILKSTLSDYDPSAVMLVTEETTTPRTFVFTKSLIGDLSKTALVVSVLELVFSFSLFIYVWCVL